MNARSLYVLIAVLVVVLVGSKSLYIVKETERAVKLRFGELVDAGYPAGSACEDPLCEHGAHL